MSIKINKTGFTMTELLIVIAIISTLAVISLPSFSKLFDSSSMDYVFPEVESLFKKARQKNYSNFDGSSYGVYFDKINSKFVYYKGSEYSKSDPSSEVEVRVKSDLLYSAPPVSVDINFSNLENLENLEFTFWDSNNRYRQLHLNKYSSIY